MPDIGLLFRLFITFSLAGDDVHQSRPLKVFHRIERFGQRLDVMTINRPNITKTQVFE